MKITTNYSRLDHLFMQIYLFPRLKIIWLLAISLWASLIYLALSGQGLFNDEICVFCILFSIFVISILAAIATSLFLIAIAVLGFSISILANSLIPGMLGEHEFELKDDGLFETTDVNETLAKWKGLRSVERYKKYIIVRTGIGFYSLPRKHFNSQEQYDEFGEQLYTHWKAHK